MVNGSMELIVLFLLAAVVLFGPLAASIEAESSRREKVILVHGYRGSPEDLEKFKEELEAYDYEGIILDLPLTYKKVEETVKIFAEQVEEIINSLEPEERVSFVGHSTGGLLIRNYLAKTDYKDKIHRSVLVATPNQGSHLAEVADRYLIFMTDIFKTLGSLTSEQVEDLKLADPEWAEIGAIAGNKEDLILGKLLTEGNDGRVEISSVRYKGLDDFIVIPYHHNEIMDQEETVRLTVDFLTEDSFKSREEKNNN